MRVKLAEDTEMSIDQALTTAEFLQRMSQDGATREDLRHGLVRLSKRDSNAPDYHEEVSFFGALALEPSLFWQYTFVTVA